MTVAYISGGSGGLIGRIGQHLTCQIASGATASDAVPTGIAAWGTFQIPSAITGATITVKYSNDGTNFTEVNETGDETNPITVSANGTYWIPQQAFGAGYIQFVSASSEAATRTIRLHFRS